MAARYGSIHSDWDGNIFYFGADSPTNDDKVIKYSPSTNSSSVVAQLPYDIFCIPTIKVDNSVLILGSYATEGRELSYFDLANGSITKLEVFLPVHLRYGGAIKLPCRNSHLESIHVGNGFTRNDIQIDVQHFSALFWTYSFNNERQDFYLHVSHV